MSAAVCSLRRCRAVLSITVLPGGAVRTSCPGCDRRRAGICRDCPNAVYGTVGKAVRCAACAARRKADIFRRWESDPDVRARRLAAGRKRSKRPAVRAKKRERRRAWAKANPEKVRRYKRQFLIRETPARERYLEAQRRYNADPVRQAKKRAHALARYYEQHPVRPDPKCACGVAIAWDGKGRPRLTCDACCSPSELRRRQRGDNRGRGAMTRERAA